MNGAFKLFGLATIHTVAELKFAIMGSNHVKDFFFFVSVPPYTRWLTIVVLVSNRSVSN